MILLNYTNQCSRGIISYPPSPSNLILCSWNLNRVCRCDTVNKVISNYLALLQSLASISILTALVHSSRMANNGLWQNNLAIAILCFSPPDNTSFQSLTESKPPYLSITYSSSTDFKIYIKSSSFLPRLIIFFWG